jgi:hypothetical protein
MRRVYLPLWFVVLLSAGCVPSPSDVPIPGSAISVPGRPGQPVTVKEFKAAVAADKALLKADKDGLDKAETARIQWWLGWIAGGGAALSLAAFFLRFWPPAAPFCWLLTPVCKYSGLLAALSFVSIWLVPWRYWIAFSAAGLILGWYALKLSRYSLAVGKVAGGLSTALDAAKKKYLPGSTKKALKAAGADLKLAESIRQEAKA